MAGQLHRRHQERPVRLEDGVSTERAGWHIMALVVLLGALGLFVAAGLGFVRQIRDRTR